MSTLLDATTRGSFDTYRDAVCRAFVSLMAEPGPAEQAFRYHLESVDLGPVRVSAVEATPHTVLRTPARIRESDGDFYKVGVQTRGHAVLRQDGREATLAPGTFTIYDTTRPYRLDFRGDYRTVVAMFPRALLRAPAPFVAERTATTFSGDEGLGRLIVSFLKDLPVAGDAAGGGAHLGEAVLDLMAAWFAGQGAGELATCPRRAGLFAGIKSFVEQNLHEPRLDAARVAAAQHISVSYLQKILAVEGISLSGWIRQLRLERCRRDLVDPAQAAKPVAAIASRWGLPDASHFSRLFKVAYGMPPGDYRTRFERSGALTAA